LGVTVRIIVLCIMCGSAGSYLCEYSAQPNNITSKGVTVRFAITLPLKGGKIRTNGEYEAAMICK
jgi:hypothetical protein